MNDFYQIFGVKPGAYGRHLYAECSYSETIELMLAEGRAAGYTDFLVKCFYLPGGDGQRRLIHTFVVSK